jgi:glycosyltransferase involved in cell wall biosynthesis
VLTEAGNDPSMPLLSVIIPAYNVAPYIRDAIASVQAQTFRDFEIVVVNDGSQDATLSILQGIAATEPRLRIISRPNTGIVGAMNDAIAVSIAPYFARMDGDDLCAPNRFQRQLDFLRSHPEVLLVGSDVEFIDSTGARLKTYRPPRDAAGIHQALLNGNSGALIHPAVMGPRRAWIDTGGYREAYRFVEDYDLFLRAALLGPLANIDESLLRYRIHAQSTNYTRRDRQTTLLKELCHDARAHAGLDQDFNFNPAPAHAAMDSVYREWAWWAVEGGEKSTARRHAWHAWRRAPWRLENVRCLTRILKASR